MVALALGIGLTTTMFSIVEGVILRGLPFEAGDRIVHLSRAAVQQPDRRRPVTPHDFVDWQAQQTTLESLERDTSRDRPNGRRLAGAVRTEQAKQFAGLEGERGAIEGAHVTEALDSVLDRKGRSDRHRRRHLYPPLSDENRPRPENPNRPVGAFHR
ncbi:MAG TPA: hypothetical protein VMM93_14795 [Vicinamibacterales bacterium]|nr:hypothetical protein [Vicinamibacterales bacterium]